MLKIWPSVQVAEAIKSPSFTVASCSRYIAVSHHALSVQQGNDIPSHNLQEQLLVHRLQKVQIKFALLGSSPWLMHGERLNFLAGENYFSQQPYRIYHFAQL